MEVKEYKATEGYYLTQVDEVGEDRLFLTAIKGANINPLAWREATAFEKEEFEKAMEEAEKERNERRL